VLISEALAEELGVVMLSLKRGLWRLIDDPPDEVRYTYAAQYWWSVGWETLLLIVEHGEPVGRVEEVVEAHMGCYSLTSPIAVAAAIVVYSFVMGFIGSSATSQWKRKQE